LLEDPSDNYSTNLEPERYGEKGSQEKAVRHQGNGVCRLQDKEGENKAFFEECLSVTLSLKGAAFFSEQIETWLGVPV
jgi:hypothetical protein